MELVISVGVPAGEDLHELGVVVGGRLSGYSGGAVLEEREGPCEPLGVGELLCVIDQLELSLPLAEVRPTVVGRRNQLERGVGLLGCSCLMRGARSCAGAALGVAARATATAPNCSCVRSMLVAVEVAS